MMNRMRITQVLRQSQWIAVLLSGAALLAQAPAPTSAPKLPYFAKPAGVYNPPHSQAFKAQMLNAGKGQKAKLKPDYVSTGCPQNGIAYNGGALPFYPETSVNGVSRVTVLANPIHIYSIFYGDWDLNKDAYGQWVNANDGAFYEDSQTFLASISNTLNWGVVEAYCDQFGSYVTSSVSVGPSVVVPAGSTFGYSPTANNLQLVVEYAISWHNLLVGAPAGSNSVWSDPYGIYMVYLHGSVSYPDSNCAEHSAFQWHGPLWDSYSPSDPRGQNQAVQWAWVGNPGAYGAPSCYLPTHSTVLHTSLETDAMINFSFHEIAETATDPFWPVSWANSGTDEIADRCAGSFGGSDPNTTVYWTPPGGSPILEYYQLQFLWSDALNQCVLH